MGFLSDIFKHKRQEQGAVIEISNMFSSFSGSAYSNAAFRAAVDAVGRHTAKLKAQTPSAKLDRLLQITPNPYISAYDLLYKTAAAYYAANNSFTLIQRGQDGAPEAFYPLNPSSVEFIGERGGGLYVKMLFIDGKQVTLPYGDIIHLRRHYSNNELLGSDNSPLYPLLETAHTLTEATAAAVKNATNIRGVLKFTSLVNPAQVKLEKDAFVRDYLSLTNTGGIAATDQRFEFQPTNIQPYNVPRETVEAVNKQIYDYLGVNEKIVSGAYTEDEFAAFYESVIEPFALQMSLEYTRKCFTERERAFGNEITFTAERLEFTSAKTRISLLRELLPFGVITINETRRLLGLPDVEDGGKRLQSLNYVNADKADEYQEIEESGAIQ
jgi:HK97 family phage portal protein